jgi:hypothetical protein
MAELAPNPGACVALIAREDGSMLASYPNDYGSGRVKAAYRAAFRQRSNIHQHRPVISEKFVADRNVGVLCII